MQAHVFYMQCKFGYNKLTFSVFTSLGFVHRLMSQPQTFAITLVFTGVNFRNKIMFNSHTL